MKPDFHNGMIRFAEETLKGYLNLIKVNKKGVKKYPEVDPYVEGKKRIDFLHGFKEMLKSVDKNRTKQERVEINDKIDSVINKIKKLSNHTKIKV